jgi:hypothetical protein
LVFRYGEAKLLKVPRGIGEAPLIRHVQGSMNIGALMQEVYDVEERGLNRHAIRFHRLGRNRAYGRIELVFLFCGSAREETTIHLDPVTVQCVLSFPALTIGLSG